jgi:mannosyltransferase
MPSRGVGTVSAVWRKHWPAWLLGLIALALRLDGLERKSVWFDEAVTYVDAHIPPGQLLESLQQDVHPPLSYLLYHLWPWLDAGDFWLRLPSAVLGALAVPVVYVWSRRISNQPTALVTACFVALAPLNIDLAQEARMYGLLLLLTALSLLLLDRLLTCPSRTSAVAYALIATAMLYTHYYAALLLAAEGAAVLASHRRAWPLLSLGAAAVLFLPWLPVLGLQVGGIASDYWIEPPSSTTLWVTFRELVAHTPPDEPFRLVLRVAYVVQAALLVLGGAVALRTKRQWPAVALATLPLALALSVSLLIAPIYAVRYVSPIGIGVAFLLASGITALPRMPAVGLAFVVFLPMLVALPALYTDPGYGRADLRAAAHSIQTQRAPEDVVVHLGAFTATPFDYYGVQGGVSLETNNRSELCKALAGHPSGWLVTAYAPADDGARDAAEAGITGPRYAGDLVRAEPERFLGTSVFRVMPC